MFHQPGLNINLNFGNQGIRRGGCAGHGGRANGPQGQMLRMMQMMLQLMARMMGQGQGGHCCSHGRPNFGSGFPAPGQGGVQFHAGASIRAFLG